MSLFYFLLFLFSLVCLSKNMSEKNVRVAFIDLKVQIYNKTKYY